jgi:excinuclease ABC subunit B
VADIMEGAYSSNQAKMRLLRKGSDKTRQFAHLSTDQLISEVNVMEEKMYDHARDLEFEQAAMIRDQIEDVKARYLDMPRHNIG